jgi:SulP family sulfate permease
MDLNIKALVIRMDRVPFIDQSGLYALEEAFFQLEKRGVYILIIGIQSQPLDKLTSINIIPNLIPESQIFNEVGQGFEWLNKQLQKEKA